MVGEGLTAKEKILLHLRDCRSRMGQPSQAVTQEGIASGIGIRRSHVPRAVKKLIQEGSVEEISARLPGKTRKMKTYELTSLGLRIAGEISEQFEDMKIVIRGVEETEMTIGEARQAFEMTTLEIIRNLTPDNILKIPEEEEAEEIEFLDRKTELAEMRDWVNRDTGVLVIYSSEGFGKTQLTKRFLKTLKRFDVFWKDLSEDDSTYEIFQGISEYMARRGRRKPLGLFEEGNIDGMISSLPDEMAATRSVYVFDNYFLQGEDIVDFFSYLAKNSRRLKKSKVLVLAKEATPSYCRFYTKHSLERKLVREMHLKGLDEENSKLLLDHPDIDEEAFRRIYLLTKGCPLYLTLIREGKEEELKRRSRYTTPEIKLLMFSKTVKAK